PPCFVNEYPVTNPELLAPPRFARTRTDTAEIVAPLGSDGEHVNVCTFSSVVVLLMYELLSSSGDAIAATFDAPAISVQLSGVVVPVASNVSVATLGALFLSPYLITR